MPFRFKAVQYLPHGTPGRYPAKPHDPEKRISRPGAASDSGRIGHFAGAAYAFLAKMAKMSSQSCRRRVRHPIRLKTEGGGAARRWQGTASANVRLLIYDAFRGSKTSFSVVSATWHLAPCPPAACAIAHGSGAGDRSPKRPRKYARRLVRMVFQALCHRGSARAVFPEDIDGFREPPAWERLSASRRTSGYP